MDKIHFKPVNRNAAWSISGGFSEEFKTESKRFKDVPFKIRKIDKSLMSQKNFKDYTNSKLGKFYIIGLNSGNECKLKWLNSNGWVGRCMCGNYEIISPRRFLKSERDRCMECWERLQILRNHHWKQHGFDISIDHAKNLY